MAFQLTEIKDKFVDESMKNATEELENIFEIKLNPKQIPDVIIVNTRQEIDSLLHYKTPRWLVGWVSGNNVFVLNYKTFTQESDNKYSDDYYIALIKHELVHIFISKFSNNHNPQWLNEGAALYFSGQTKQRKKINRFNNFLEFYNSTQIEKNHVYEESGFAIEVLYNKFGKEKLIELLQIRSVCHSEKSFDLGFKKIYGFVPTYTKFNQLHLTL